ncbi:MAG: CPBP family intramembrane glutamic endopeptidase [Ilumatobacteraceae bacterium]
MVAVLAILVLSNVLMNRVLPGWSYVPWNLAVAGLIVWVANDEVSLAEMGFTRWRSGALWGFGLIAATAVVLSLSLLVPVFRELFDDRRVDGGAWTWAYQALVRIPLGTAVLEETAFRAVLPALFARRLGVMRGCVVASLWFGLWHVLPAWNLHRVNPVAERIFGDGTAGLVAALVFAVIGTMVAGLWWCWVRYRSGSVLSTMLGHVASNSVAYTIAFLVDR